MSSAVTPRVFVEHAPVRMASSHVAIDPVTRSAVCGSGCRASLGRPAASPTAFSPVA